MKIRTLILCLLCTLLLAACSKGDAASAQPPAETAVPIEIVQAETPAPTHREEQQISISFSADAQPTAVPMTPTPTAEPTAEPTIEPTPEPTDTPVPMLGVLDG